MAHNAIQTYVQQLYQHILLRDGESNGIAVWAGDAEKGLTSIDMVKGFIGSPEAQKILAVLRLYDIFFDRAADSGGLTYWVTLLRGGASMHDVALAFTQSSEYQAKYTGTSTGDYVETLYGNLFERASDAGGKAYWIDLIDSGKMSRAEVALAFTLSDEAAATTGAATRFAESYLVLRASGLPEPSTAAVEALAHKSLTEAIMDVQTIHGTVQNGIIQNASVYRDANSDGLPDTDSSAVTTDANGKFILIGGYGDIVVTSGQDLTTGKTNDKLLSTTTARPGMEVMVTPLTTIINAIVNQGVNVAEAVKKVNMAFGLDAGIDLLTFNHTTKATGPGTTAVEQKNAVAVKGAIAQLTILMEDVAGLIKGAAGKDTILDATTITASVANALADKIISATANTTPPESSVLVALNSQDVIRDIVTSTAAKVSAAGTTSLSAIVVNKIAGLAIDAAKVISALNTTIKITVEAVTTNTLFTGKVIDAFSIIGKTEALAQDSIQTAITAAAASGSLSNVSASYTGTNLGAAIRLSTLGPLANGVDSSAGGNLIDYVIDTVLDPKVANNPTNDTGGAPGPTFTVTENAGRVSFSGTASGEITVTFDGTIASFMRQNTVAAVKPDFGGTAKTIELAGAQTLSLTQASLGKIIGDAGIYIDAKDTSAIRLTGVSAAALSNDIAKLRAADVTKISLAGADGQHLTIDKADLDKIGALIADAADNISLTNATTSSLATDQAKIRVSAGGTFTYSLAAGQAALGAQDYVNIAALVAIVDGASNLAASNVTVTINGNATVADIQALLNLGVGLVNISYSLKDALNNLLPSGAAASVITGNVNVAVTDAATVAQIGLIDAANGTGTLTYTLNDTLANLTTASMAVLSGATNYSVSNTSGLLTNISVAQAVVLASAVDKADYTYSLRDTVANLLPSGAAASVIAGNVNVAVTDAATVAQIGLIHVANGTGTLTYILNDTLANLTPAGAGIISGSTSYSVSNTSGLLPNLTVAQAVILAGAADKADYTYSLSDTVANLSSANAGIVSGAANYTVLDNVAHLLPSGAAASVIAGNVNVAVTDAATVAQIGLIDAANGTGALTYMLNDTLASLATAGAGIISGATSYSVSNANGLLANLSVAQAVVLAGAADKADYTYSLSDTLNNLLPSGAAASVITGNVNVAVTNAATVAQIGLIDAANGTGTLTYTLNDTLANLTTASMAVLSGATNYSVSNTSGLLTNITVAQAVILAGAADKADYTYSLSDTVANLSSANAGIVSGAANYTVLDNVAHLLPSGTAASVIVGNVNVAVTDAATVAQISLIDAANGTGALTYTLNDSLDNLVAASTSVVSGATSYSVSNTAGALDNISVARATIMASASNRNSYTYGIADDASTVNAASTVVLNSATAIFATASSASDNLDWSRNGTVSVRINIDLNTGDDTFTGGSGEDYIKGNTGADVIDGGPGRDFYLYSDGTKDSVVTSGTSLAAGFDTVTVTSTDAFYLAQFGALRKVLNATNPADTSGNGLLAALDNAYSSAQGGAKDVLFVQFQNGDQYLVVNDGVGGGLTIDAADTVIKVVGAYSPTVANVNLIIGV